jgi:hypothetical protein
VTATQNPAAEDYNAAIEKIQAVYGSDGGDFVSVLESVRDEETIHKVGYAARGCVPDCVGCLTERIADAITKAVTGHHHEALGHHYVSTACLHGLCDERCRRTCKFCDALCAHGCHTGEPVGDLPPAWLDQARDIARELLARSPADLLPGDLIDRVESDPHLFWLRGEEQPPGVLTPPEERP